jgi:hypothetical protein
MKSRTLPNGAFNPDAAAVRVNDVAGNGEAESGAARLARSRGVHAVKTLENALKVGLRNSDAGIGDRKRDFLSIRPGAHIDLPPRGCILHRVVEQILQNLAYLSAIRANRRQSFGQFNIDPQTSRFRLEARSLDATVHKRLNANRTKFEVEPPGFDARKLQEIVGQPGQTPGVLADDFNETLSV